MQGDNVTVLRECLAALTRKQLERLYRNLLAGRQLCVGGWSASENSGCLATLAAYDNPQDVYNQSQYNRGIDAYERLVNVCSKHSVIPDTMLRETTAAELKQLTEEELWTRKA